MAGFSVGSLISPGLLLWYTSVHLKRPCMEKKHVCSQWCLTRLKVGCLCACVCVWVSEIKVKRGWTCLFLITSETWWAAHVWSSKLAIYCLKELLFVCVLDEESEWESWECISSKTFCSCLYNDSLVSSVNVPAESKLIFALIILKYKFDFKPDSSDILKWT